VAGFRVCGVEIVASSSGVFSLNVRVMYEGGSN
jgi:hypothetical protein